MFFVWCVIALWSPCVVYLGLVTAGLVRSGGIDYSRCSVWCVWPCFVCWRWLGAAQIEHVNRRCQWWEPVASDKVRVYVDRWTPVLWLVPFCDAGMGHVAPPISMRARTAFAGCGGWVRCIWIVYTWQRSVEVLRLKWSLVLRIMVCCLAVRFRSLRPGRTVFGKWSPVSLCRSVLFCRDPATVLQPVVYGDSVPVVRWRPVTLGVVGPKMTVMGSIFVTNCKPHGMRRCPSLGVVKLDTGSRFLGLNAFYDVAEPVRLLLGRAENVISFRTPEWNPGASTTFR